MADSLIRLAWALPLVIGLGFAALLVLRRLGIGMPPPPATQSPQVLSRTPLSERTVAIVVQLGSQQWLVVESDAAAVSVEPLPPSAGPLSSQRINGPFHGYRKPL